jgi:hypothetical protein
MILTPAEMFLILCIAGLAYALHKEKKEIYIFKVNITETLMDLHEGRATMTAYTNHSGGKTIRVIPKGEVNENVN